MTAATTTRELGRDLIVLAALLVLTLQGFANHVDLHIADEANYAYQGTLLLSGSQLAHVWGLGPIYSGAYALLELLPLRGAAALDAMAVILAVASTLAMYACLRACGARSVAVFGAMWWTSSEFVASYPLRIYLFTTTLCLLAVACLARRRRGLGLALLALAACNRQEILPWLLGASVGLAVLGWRRRQPPVSRPGLVFALLAVALLVGFGLTPGASDHAWHAFQWHHALDVGRGDVIADRERLAAVVAKTYPGAHSVPEAMLVNPLAVAEHALHAAAAVPGMAVYHLTHPFFHLPWLRWTWLLGAAALLGFGLLRPRLEPRLPAGAAIALAASPLLLPGLLVLFPRPDVLLPLSPLLFVSVARGLERGVRALPRAAVAGGSSSLLALLLGIVAIAGGPFSAPVVDLPPARQVVRLLRRADIPPTASVVASTPQLPRLAGVEARTFDFAELADRGWQPDYLAVTSVDLVGASGPGILAALNALGWQVVGSGWSSLLLRKRQR